MSLSPDVAALISGEETTLLLRRRRGGGQQMGRDGGGYSVGETTPAQRWEPWKRGFAPTGSPEEPAGTRPLTFCQTQTFSRVTVTGAGFRLATRRAAARQANPRKGQRHSWTG